MKKFFILLFFGCFCTMCYSQVINMDLQVSYDYENGATTSPRQHKAPARLPSISYDDSHVYVVAPFLIESATIIIYNEDGEVIYSTVTPLGTTAITLNLSQYVCDERYSLELVYGSMDLIGYF